MNGRRLSIPLPRIRENDLPEDAPFFTVVEILSYQIAF